MSSGGGDRGKSPGKGGKSLELMQKRMQIQQQQNQSQQQAPGALPGPIAARAPPPPQQQATGQQQQAQHMTGAPHQQRAPMAPPKHQLPQGNVTNPLDLSSSQPAPHPQQPIVTHQQVNQVNTSSKPKGKDFALMSIQAPRPVPVQPHHPPPSLPSPRQPQQQPTQPQQQQQQQPHQTVQAAPVAGKPKGKDFSAMASRMTPDARAAAMQAGARQAAGMPPLDRPTANSVTATPATIPAPRYTPPIARTQQQQQQMPPHPQQLQMQIPHAQPNQTHPQQQMPHGGVSHMGSSSSGSAPPPSPQAVAAAAYNRRNSGPSSEQRLSPQPMATAKPSPAPSAKEGTLASPHMAPLVGPRVRDLVQSLDPSYSIEASAEKQVLELVDDFLEKVCKQSIRLATHRGSKTLDVQDVQLILAKQWGITIPGLGPPQKSGPAKAASTNNNKRKAAPSSSAPASSKAQTTEEPRPS